MQQFDFDFLVRVGEGTVLVVLTGLFVDETLAILGFVAGWVVELLDFVVSELAGGNIAGFGLALDVRVGDLTRVPTPVAFVVVESAAGQLVHIRRLLTIGTELGLEGLEIEPEELVPHKELEFFIVVIDAVEAGLTIVIEAF